MAKIDKNLQVQELQQDEVTACEVVELMLNEIGTLARAFNLIDDFSKLSIAPEAALQECEQENILISGIPERLLH